MTDARTRALCRAYHFTGNTLRDGRPVPAVGEWLEHTGPVVMCQTGLHASRTAWDALSYAPGNILHVVDCSGIAQEDDDKLVCTRRRIIASRDMTRVMRQFAGECAALACWCAGLTGGVYEAAADATSAFARGEISEADMKAQWAAVRAAARDAARDAAWAAARDAAGDAAWAARDAAWAAGDAAWAARDAAWAAVRAAAWDAAWAAWAAARNAARDAARDACRSRWEELAREEFSR